MAVKRSWITAAEAARRIGVHKRTVIRWIWAGELKARPIGGRWAIEPRDLEEFLRRQRAPLWRRGIRDARSPRGGN